MTSGCLNFFGGWFKGKLKGNHQNFGGSPIFPGWLVVPPLWDQRQVHPQHCLRHGAAPKGGDYVRSLEHCEKVIGCIPCVQRLIVFLCVPFGIGIEGKARGTQANWRVPWRQTHRPACPQADPSCQAYKLDPRSTEARILVTFSGLNGNPHKAKEPDGLERPR